MVMVVVSAMPAEGLLWEGELVRVQPIGVRGVVGAVWWWVVYRPGVGFAGSGEEAHSCVEVL